MPLVAWGGGGLWDLGRSNEYVVRLRLGSVYTVLFTMLYVFTQPQFKVNLGGARELAIDLYLPAPFYSLLTPHVGLANVDLRIMHASEHATCVESLDTYGFVLVSINERGTCGPQTFGIGYYLLLTGLRIDMDMSNTYKAFPTLTPHLLL